MKYLVDSLPCLRQVILDSHPDLGQSPDHVPHFSVAGEHQEGGRWREAGRRERRRSVTYVRMIS